MARGRFRRWLQVSALVATLSVAAVALPVDAALVPTGSLPQVCGYLGLMNGTRQIDPSFAAGTRPPSPPAATTSLNSGALLLRINTVESSRTTATTSSATSPESNYCHTLPALAPLDASGT